MDLFLKLQLPTLIDYDSLGLILQHLIQHLVNQPSSKGMNLIVTGSVEYS